MAARGRKPAAPKKKANGYKMPDPIPVGEVIIDNIGKKKWRIGPSIGVGGFGEIYSACDHLSSPKKAANYPFVIKIEPHENGPLFVEKIFYIRNANSADIAKYMKEKKLSSFGMPTFFGNGSHEYKGEKYRYLVLERYGKDLWNLFLANGKLFPPVTVFQLGLQMLDILEYIHGRGYVHADIKGANILMGLKKGTENQAYLVDFGLATRVNDKEFKPDPKSAHNGTIEYTSRDAHLGVATMRGDLEILGYNMLQWLTGRLPWEHALKQPKVVQTLKEAFMANVRASVTKQYTNVPDALIKFFEYINTLKPKEIPDFVKCRQLFESYLKSEGKAKNGKLNFTSDGTTAKASTKTNGETSKPKRGKKQIVVDNSDDEESTEMDSKEDKTKNRIDSNTNNNSDKDSTAKSKQSVVPKAKRGRKPVIIEDSDNEESDEKVNKRLKGNTQNDVHKDLTPKSKQNEVPKVKKSRKAKTVEVENSENKEPDTIVKVKAIQRLKRKSSEPSVLVKIKKTKLAPKATPPSKKAAIARRSPRQVSFDSPICEVIGDKKPLKVNESINSSGDIFEDSFTMEGKKVKPKRKLISVQEGVVKGIVRKKLTSVKKGKL